MDVKGTGQKTVKFIRGRQARIAMANGRDNTAAIYVHSLVLPFENRGENRDRALYTEFVSLHGGRGYPHRLVPSKKIKLSQVSPWQYRYGLLHSPSW